MSLPCYSLQLSDPNLTRNSGTAGPCTEAAGSCAQPKRHHLFAEMASQSHEDMHALGPDASNVGGSLSDRARQARKVACLACRDKKLRCDAVMPICGNCARLDKTCHFDTIRKKTGPKRGYLRNLEARLCKSYTRKGLTCRRVKQANIPKLVQKGCSKTKMMGVGSLAMMHSTKNNSPYYQAMSRMTIDRPLAMTAQVWTGAMTRAIPGTRTTSRALLIDLVSTRLSLRRQSPTS